MRLGIKVEASADKNKKCDNRYFTAETIKIFCYQLSQS
jgi:hypothetical protein